MHQENALHAQHHPRQLEPEVRFVHGLRIDRAESPTDPSGLLTLLQAMRDFVLDHRWSMSSAELWLLPDSPAEQIAQAHRAADGVEWLSGAELLALAVRVTVANWGAFLAFKQSASDFAFGIAPRSEGEVQPIQHPLAEAEVQAVDGCYFEVYSRQPEVCATLRERFAGSLREIESNQTEKLR